MCDNDQLTVFMAASRSTLFSSKPKEHPCAEAYEEFIYQLDKEMDVEEVVENLEKDDNILLLFVHTPSESCLEQRCISAILKNNTEFSAHILALTNFNGKVDKIYVQNYQDIDYFTEVIRASVREKANMDPLNVKHLVSDRDLIKALMG